MPKGVEQPKGLEPSTGVLLIQLGTPDAPTAPALRRYLHQFLSDPRVIEAPRLTWWLVLHMFILRSRPRQSAAKYQLIWDPATGSPLLHWTRRQTEELQKQLAGVPVAFGMQVGNPPLSATVHELIERGIDRLVVLPMYPQYSATTTASATDVLFQALMRERRVPALRIVPPYYRHPAYLEAMAAVIRDDLARLPWQPEHYLLSFHGIPIRYAQGGDPYATHVKRTTAGLVQRLGWPRERWTQTFQSLFGREEWLKPYTEQTLVRLAKQGVKRVFVATPGFTSDCLETIDEIGREAREAFQHAGGEQLHRCPCLNDHPAWIEAMKTLILEEAQGWLGD
ncbi:MAG TPA: ferrochelatase [Gemmataceae bacterium]|nr:ferrochelatase [Gemmataceae bacterium]